MAVGDRLAGPLHRCRAESVEREHAGRAVERPLIDDQGEILLASMEEMPAATPAALNPLANVTLTVLLQSS